MIETPSSTFEVEITQIPDTLTFAASALLRKAMTFIFSGGIMGNDQVPVEVILDGLDHLDSTGKHIKIRGYVLIPQKTQPLSMDGVINIMERKGTANFKIPS